MTHIKKMITAMAVLMLSSQPMQAQGPIVLGGDDLVEHGSISGGQLQNGWKYMKLALEDIMPKVNRPNDSRLAALGSGPPIQTGDAADAISKVVDDISSITGVDFYEGAGAINGFFSDLSSGITNPAIIWIPGNAWTNNLDAAEGAALTNNANIIADFVNEGGGLMSHGMSQGNYVYGWLSALYPGLNAVVSGSAGDLALTPVGNSSLPTLTNIEINAGPWHNHFEGNMGYLKVLVASGTLMNSDSDSAAVIIGGDSVIVDKGDDPEIPEECCEPCIPCEVQWIFIILVILLLLFILLAVRDVANAIRQDGQ